MSALFQKKTFYNFSTLKKLFFLKLILFSFYKKFNKSLVTSQITRNVLFMAIQFFCFSPWWVQVEHFLNELV